jgi:hypothetical protein
VQRGGLKEADLRLRDADVNEPTFEGAVVQRVSHGFIDPGGIYDDVGELAVGQFGEAFQFIAATVLAGSIGQQYRVDYADVVTVGTTNWLVLTNITLPSSPYLVIDPSSAGRTQRYYRAVPVP